MIYTRKHGICFKVIAIAMSCLFLWNDIESEASSSFSPSTPPTNNLSAPLKTNDPDFDGVFDYQIIKNIVGRANNIADAYGRLCSSPELEEHFRLLPTRMFGTSGEVLIELPELRYSDGYIYLRLYDTQKVEPTVSSGDIRLMRSIDINGISLEIIGVGKPIETKSDALTDKVPAEVDHKDLSVSSEAPIEATEVKPDHRDKPVASYELQAQSIVNTKHDKKYTDYIPFYSYLSTSASRKAFSVVALGCLWAVMSTLIGGGYVAYTLFTGSFGNTIYSSMILLMMIGGSFGVAELIVVQVLMLKGQFKQELPPEVVSDEALPTVLVQIPVRNEPVDVVMETVIKATKISYPAHKLSIQIIDNTNTTDQSGSYIKGNSYELLKKRFDADESIIAFNNVNGEGSAVLLHRDSKVGYKSGNLNMGLRYDEERRNSEYILQLDADSCVETETLRLVMPEFVHHEANRKLDEPRLAFVQITLDVSNPDEGPIAWAVSGMHHIYEMFVMPVRSDYRFVSSFGHHIIFSHEAVSDVGGHPEDIGLAEDADLAIGIQTVSDEYGGRKWHAKRISYHALKESVPSSFRALKIQRWRWSFGNTRVGIKRFFDVMNSDLKWNEKFFVLLDLSTFIIIVFLLIIPAYLVPPAIAIAQIMGGVTYPDWLSAGIIIQWITPFTLLYISSLHCFNRKSPQAAVDAIFGFIGNTSLMFALTPTLVNAAINGMIHKEAAFNITPRNNDSETSMMDIFRDNRSEILSGLYFLIFIPFMPMTVGYSIPACIMGFSLIAWPYHNKISGATKAAQGKMKYQMARLKKALSTKGFLLNDGEESMGWTKLAISGIVLMSIATALRFMNLDYLGPWMDEATYIDAGRDYLNPAMDWGWINGWKYAFPIVAWYGTNLFGSFIGARYVTAALGVATILVIYLFSRCVMSDLFKDQPEQNEKRSLFAVGALSFAMPLVLISRLATYDTLAYFFVALSLYLINLGSKPNKEKLLVLAAATLALGFMSKYVVILLIPFIASYALLLMKDNNKWYNWFVRPLLVTLGAFIIPNAFEIAIGVSLTGKGFWVNTSILGVALYAFKIVAPYVMLSVIGFLKIPKENRAHAWWLLGGSLTLVAYHIFDRHVQAMAKDLSIYLIFSAPIIGIGLSWLMSLKVHVKKAVDRLFKFVFIGIIVFSGYFMPRKAMEFWEDLYAPVNAIHKYASVMKAPSIFTTRPHELILFYPELATCVNQHADSVSLDPKYLRYANTRYVQSGNDTVLDIVAERYDIVHITQEILEDWNTEDPAYSRNIKRALKNSGYIMMLYDNMPGENELGVTRKPSYSAVYIHPRVFARWNNDNEIMRPVFSDGQLDPLPAQQNQETVKEYLPVVQDNVHQPAISPKVEYTPQVMITPDAVPTLDTTVNSVKAKPAVSSARPVSALDDAAKNRLPIGTAATASFPAIFLMMLSTMEIFNKRFQGTYVSSNKPVIYIVPSDVIHESQRKLRTELNKLSEESLRPEKIYVVNVDGLSVEERTAKILEKARYYRDKYENCTIIAAANSEEDMSFLRDNNIRSLIFKEIDLYTILTALRAFYRVFYEKGADERKYGLDAILMIYKNLTGNEFSLDTSKLPDDEGALNDILKALIFEIPSARRFEYDNELMSLNKKMRLLITFA